MVSIFELSDSFILSASAVGLLLLPWSALYADVSKALSSIMLPMLLISPVFYPAVKDTDSWLFWINSVNPVASPLAIISDLFQSNEYALYLLPMTLWAGTALVLVIWSLSQLKNKCLFYLRGLETDFATQKENRTQMVYSCHKFKMRNKDLHDCIREIHWIHPNFMMVLSNGY